LIVRVIAERKPERCVPPSCVLMLFGEREFDRVVAVVPLQRDLGVDAVAVAVHEDRLLVDDALVFVQVLDERDDAAVVVEAMALAASRSSSSVIVTPAFRNASSRNRPASVSKLNSTISKICGSGLNVTLVPRRFVVPVTMRSASGLPRS
jgi:hypothetical protein